MEVSLYSDLSLEDLFWSCLESTELDRSSLSVELRSTEVLNRICEKEEHWFNDTHFTYYGCYRRTIFGEADFYVIIEVKVFYFGIMADESASELKKEIMKLRRLFYEEKKKSFEEREKRLRLESWFREHLHRCKSKIAEVALESSSAEAAVQTDVTLTGKLDWTPIDSDFKLSQHPTPCKRWLSVPSCSSSSTVEKSCVESASTALDSSDCQSKLSTVNVGNSTSVRKPRSLRRRTYVLRDRDLNTCQQSVSPSKGNRTSEIKNTKKGLYFINLDGAINCATDVNPKAVDRLKAFLMRSSERQQKIKRASLLRQQLAQEKNNAVSKLLSGEARPEETLPLFGRLPASAFSMSRITNETRIRFQRTAEFRRFQAAQLEAAHRKCNRLHAVCFSEALRLRPSTDGFRKNFNSALSLSRRTSNSWTHT